MQAFLVLLRYDLGQMARSWIVRVWVALLFIPALFVVGVAAMRLLMVGSLLAFLAALGILLSTAFRNVQLSVLCVLISVLLSGLALQFLGLKWMSATAVINELPDTFRGHTSLWTGIRVF